MLSSPQIQEDMGSKIYLPIFQPSQITEINPKPNSYLSHLTNTDIDALRVHQGQALLTCSGTIGNCTYVSKTLDNFIFSHDVIRINCKKEGYPGYLYAFLNTEIGKALVRTNEYGAVVSHIEPEHLEHVPLPNPSPILIKRIDDLITRSFALRDASDEMLKEADKLLHEILNLPPMKKLNPQYYKSKFDLRNYTVRLSRLNGRLDALSMFLLQTLSFKN
jgi:type I restriction enzyme S subunit